jgi:hypothetical protein
VVGCVWLETVCLRAFAERESASMRLERERECLRAFAERENACVRLEMSACYWKESDCVQLERERTHACGWREGGRERER